MRRFMSWPWLVATLALAAIPRAAWVATHGPVLPPDAFGYLNLAREIRGLDQPSEWDDKTFLPADNQAARTPGYPLFLNLVFAIAGHSASPPEAVDRAARQHVPPGPRHLERLTTDENVRAVQLAQAALGVLATGLAFSTLLRWTGSRSAAAIGSLVSVGWDPVWIVMFEPALLTEVLAGTLLLAAIWLLDRTRTAREEIAVSLLCGFNILVRPAMVFAAIPILAYIVWQRGVRPARVARVLAPAASLVALLVVFNGVRYGYWGVSSASGATMLSHATMHPEAIIEPLNRIAVPLRGNVSIGLILEYQLMYHEHVSYLEAVERVNEAAARFVVEHPLLYARSVIEALVEFCSPTIRQFPYEINAVRNFSRWLWYAIVAAESGLVLAGAAALVVRGPAAAKVATASFALAAIGAALTAHTENRRFAVPLEPLLFMSGTAVIASLTRSTRSTRTAPETRARRSR